MVRRLFVALAMFANARAAYASPRTDPTVGRAVFTGATAGHPTSITLNPAALGQGTWDEVYLALATTLDRIGIRLDALDANGDLSRGTPLDATELGPGGMIAYVGHIGERGTFGIEAHTPPPELFPKGFEALRYHTLGKGQRDWLVTAAGAFRVTNRLFFGASLSHDNTFLTMRYARDTALDTGVDSDCGGAPCGVGNDLAAERFDVRVRSEAVATSNLKVNVGVLARIYGDIWLGLAYHTPPGFDIQSTLRGSMEVTRAPRDGGELLHGDSTVYVHFPASVDGEIRARLQPLLDLHVGGRWEDLSRMQAYDVRGYGSTFVRNGVPEWTERPRGFQDPFALWAGVEQVDDGSEGKLLFGARLGVETRALHDEDTSPLTISPTSFTVDLGAQWRVSRSLVLQLSYGLQYFGETSVTNSGFDPRFIAECTNSGFDYTTAACQGVRDGYALPTAAGDYQRIQHAVRFGLVYERR